MPLIFSIPNLFLLFKNLALQFNSSLNNVISYEEKDHNALGCNFEFQTLFKMTYQSTSANQL